MSSLPSPVKSPEVMYHGIGADSDRIADRERAVAVVAQHRHRAVVVIGDRQILPPVAGEIAGGDGIDARRRRCS